VHFDTGLSWVDADDDFSRARRRQVLARLAGWLRRRPDADRILSFDEVVAALGWRGEHYVGLQTIQLDTVAGTVDSGRDFDRRFRPTSNRVRQRWEGLDLAQRRGVAIPPIDVYRVGGLHFVKDGHHRVSVARATGHKTIEAYVTEVLTRIPATGLSAAGGLPLKAAGSGGAIPGSEDTGNRETAGRADALQQPGRGSSR
jgi:hypothetical protein